MLVNVVALVARLVDPATGEQIRADVLDRGAALGNGARILEGERLARRVLRA